MSKTRRVPNIELADCPMSLGRSAENDLVLTHTAVSRRHCLIEVVNGEAILRDLDSRHGTRVNGRRISDATKVIDGDVIRVGPFEMVFGPVVPAAAPTATAADDFDPAAAAMDEMVEALRGELAEARGLVKAEASRAQQLEQDLDERRSREQEQSTRIEQLESELESARQSLQRTERDLEGRQKKLEETEADVTVLEEQVEHRDRTSREATRQVELLQEALARFETTVEDLRVGSQRMSAVQRNLRALEALWVEANDWVEEAERSGDPLVINQATTQRDNVGDRLEAAHADRDEALAELQALVGRLNETSVPPPWQPPPPPRQRRASLAKRVIQAIGDRR